MFRIQRLAVVSLLLSMVAVVGAAEKSGAVKTTKNPKDGAEMVLIPAGQFLMGTTTGEVDTQFVDTGLPVDWKKHAEDEAPRHPREVKAFYLYKYEVTNAQYRAFTAATKHRTPPHWKGADFLKGRADHPVVEVSWDDASAYCRWAGTQLPTEAQWEYAARGKSHRRLLVLGRKPGRVYPWGNKWDRKLSNNASLHAGKDLVNAETWNVWYKGKQKANYPLTTRGGSFPRSISPFGIHDMAGNAWEWCRDHQLEYQSKAKPTKSTLRARRGGSWANVALHIRSADRQGAPQDNLNIYTGFRCMKMP
ncbi:MAG: hypothetical protein CMJ65_11615 [Planctomycetaceae bacterium]|nr:hypothetical protein [Planctomycetaceae bacterium]